MVEFVLMGRETACELVLSKNGLRIEVGGLESNQEACNSVKENG